jgi:hypothetical protein
MRKTVGAIPEPATNAAFGALDVAKLAHVFVTSEDPAHPIDHAFDGHGGPGATAWVAAQAGAQSITVAFDEPQNVRAIALEIEEPALPRTQELELSIALAGSDTFQVLVRQEYTFSPPGTSFERETWTVAQRGISRVRIAIRPDKQAESGARARLTSLAIYGS